MTYGWLHITHIREKVAINIWISLFVTEKKGRFLALAEENVTASFSHCGSHTRGFSVFCVEYH